MDKWFESIKQFFSQLAFNPPTWMDGYARYINAALIVGALAAVVLIYRLEGRRTGPRIFLGCMRALIFLFVIALLNRPVLQYVSYHTEPSVIAILVDDSISMRLRDTGQARPTTQPTAASTTQPASPSTRPVMVAATTQPGVPTLLDDPNTASRLEAAVALMTDEDQALLRQLGKVHQIRFYRFNKDATSVGALAVKPDEAAKEAELPAVDPALLKSINELQPQGQSTQVVPSLLTVLDDLQGQRLAGVVVLTDARETPSASPPALLERLKKYNAKVIPVLAGSTKPPVNVEVTSISMQDSAFKDDIFAVKATVRGSGYEVGQPVRLRVTNKKTGVSLKDPEGRPLEKTVTLPPDGAALEEEFLVKPDAEGQLVVDVVADLQPGELTADDNSRDDTISVLDAKINVLYVEGYPRWEYRYIKNEMIRDSTVNISLLLTSADSGFAQEGDDPIPDFGVNDPRTGTVFLGPVVDFPLKMDDLKKYDVVLFGDVDPRRFTDAQIQMLAKFVSEEGGGFGMIAGPKHSPIAYKNTLLEAVLPVNISMVQPEDSDAMYRDGWRPVLTDEGKRGEASTIFRFFNDPKVNEKYLKDDLELLYWWSQGVTAKPGVGLVYAEHPIATDPTGRKAPILVLGRFGAGRTLFSGIDDSWRWRRYTGESVFDTYWVQQIRYLARSKKLGQQKVRFVTDRNSYELGDRVKIDVKVVDPVLLQQLGPQLRVEIVDEQGRPVRTETLNRQETPPELYSATVVLPVGRYTARLPKLGEGAEEQELSFKVEVPRLELAEPAVDRTLLGKMGVPPDHVLTLADAKAKLPTLLKSASRTYPEYTPKPLWNHWIVLGIFVLLLTVEWVLRKVFGML